MYVCKGSFKTFVLWIMQKFFTLSFLSLLNFTLIHISKNITRKILFQSKLFSFLLLSRNVYSLIALFFLARNVDLTKNLDNIPSLCLLCRIKANYSYVSSMQTKRFIYIYIHRYIGNITLKDESAPPLDIYIKD